MPVFAMDIYSIHFGKSSLFLIPRHVILQPRSKPSDRYSGNHAYSSLVSECHQRWYCSPLSNNSISSLTIPFSRLHPQCGFHHSLWYDVLLCRQSNWKRAWPSLSSILLVGSWRNVGWNGRILALHRRHQLQQCSRASYIGTGEPDKRFHDARGSGSTRMYTRFTAFARKHRHRDSADGIQT